MSSYLLTISFFAGSLLAQTAQVAGGGAAPGPRPVRIFGPGILASDVNGNLYLAVRDGVFEIDSSGIRERIAGTEGNWRYSGDGGPAIQAGLNPRAITVGVDGNLYLADAGNNRIRKLDLATGQIETVAGSGIKGFSGDGGSAVNAQLDNPTGVAVDRSGNIYIADGTVDGTDRIRKVSAANGNITTVAGTGMAGYSGDGGPAIVAQFNSLGGLAADAQGNLYIADNYNNRIRMISAATGIITTVAGNGVAGRSGDGGLAVNGELNNPLSVAVDTAGNLFIADSGNQRIRRVALPTRTITTAGNGPVTYPNALHTFPCAIALDAAGNLYIADSGVSRIRSVPANIARESVTESESTSAAAERSFVSSGGFKINVTYDPNVPSAAQTAFNSLVSTYESVFTSNVTVNIDVAFGNTGLGASDTSAVDASYSSWRSAMIANANANPGNTYAVAAAASLPASDPVGKGTVQVNTANARALGLTANASVDSSLTFSNSVAFEYDGVANNNVIDFLDVAAHELDEGLGIGSALTGLLDNATLPLNDYAPEDYFRYSAAGTRAITTSPNAVVYFSYDGGTTNVAQFNQAYSAQGESDLDRNDWIYGNFGCPVSTPHVQDAILCYGQVTPIGSGPEITVLNSLGYNSRASQTITFGALENVILGVAPFSISATASSGLPVSFVSTTMPVCTVSGSTVTILSAGTCSITASQAGNASYSAAPPVMRSFTVSLPLPPPSTPVLVSPANGAGTSLAPSLSWDASSGATSYDVHFETSPTPGLATNTTATSYAPGTLAAGTTYYWQIVAKNSAGSAPSVIWSFTAQSLVASPVTPIVDFNGDGKQDVFLYDPVGGNGYVGLSNGTGAFTYVSNPFTPGFDTIRYGDLNGDGKTDLIAYNSTSTLGYALIGNGNGTFRSVSLFWGPGFNRVAAGDLNGDGKTDFVIYRTTDGTCYTAISNGDGTFRYQYTLVSIGFTHMVVADFNGDGRADVFYYRSTDGLAFLGIGNGTGGFTFSPVALAPGYAFVEAGDFNGDGKADLLLYSSTSGTTTVGLSTGATFALTAYAYSPGFTSVKLFDFNGDGKADVAFYNKSTAIGYLGIGSGTGSFTFSSLFWGSGVDTVDALDLNGDGKLDIITYNSTNGASYTGISSGSASSPFAYQYSYWGNGRVLATAVAVP